ncbi:MAG: hypothetical protein H3C38_00825 [Rhodospirillales bacterium]|nr:hypothetical protein [Rhodospirillales bacterium]
MARRSAHQRTEEERRLPGAAPLPRTRLVAANDNVPPLSFTLRRVIPWLLLAALTASLGWHLLP